jgi:hypothetical protein
MFTKTNATSLAAVPDIEVATWSLKTDSTPLDAVPRTEVAICSLKLMIHP